VWGAIVQLIAGVFKAVFGVLMKNPIEDKEDFRDVGDQPENPDDAFSDSDW